MSEPETPREDLPQDPSIPGAPVPRTADEPSPPEVDDTAARLDDPDNEGHQSEP
jgi:hypothetical protein